MSAGRIQLVRGFAATTADRGDGDVGFRVLGANNRELGRSVHRHAAVDGAVAELGLLRREVAALAVVSQVETRTGRWSWRVRLGVEVVVAASRTYQRRREADASAALVVALLAAAPVAADVLDLTRRGRHRPDLGRTYRVHRAPVSCS